MENKTNKTFENKYSCLECGKIVSECNSYIGSHTKRIHKLTLIDYCHKHYSDLDPDFKPSKCGFCDRDSEVFFDISHSNKTIKKYHKKYFCGTIECKEKVSLKILGVPYDKKTFEHIGSKIEYMCAVNNISPEEARKIKGSHNNPDTLFRCNLEGYIKKYGEEEGTLRFKDRCKRVAITMENMIIKYGDKAQEMYDKYIQKGKFSNSREGYIHKHGTERGLELWNERLRKQCARFGKQSSKQVAIGKILKKFRYKIVEERDFKNRKGNTNYVDFYLPNCNVVIEFYGDFWHQNPKFWSKNQINKKTKMTAKETWQKDKERIEDLMKYFNNPSVIVIWENSYNDIINEKIDLKKTISDIKNKGIYLEI